jgi:hypothetical protein
MGRPMSARHDPRRPDSPPFAGTRLEDAIWAPRRPDALVVAHPSACEIVPDAVRRGTPWIVALKAAERLWRSVPSATMRICWDRGEDPSDSEAKSCTEREALFVAHLMLLMLRVAPPAELIWLSQHDG